MMETMRSARNYTTEQIKPLLQTHQLHERVFLPQTVPAYAATESFNYLRKRYPDYVYHEATLNPTNPRDRAVDWEADVINNFRNHGNDQELIGDRTTLTGKYLFLAQPIRAAQPCLDCHDTAQRLRRRWCAATASQRIRMEAERDRWGADRDGPFAVPVRMADRAFQIMVIYLAGIFLVSLVLLDLLLLFVDRPAGVAAIGDGGPDQLGKSRRRRAAGERTATRSPCWRAHSTGCGEAW